MKTANTFVTLAVLGLAACLAPVVGAQANPPQKQPQKAQHVVATANAVQKPRQQAHPASAKQKRVASRTAVHRANTAPVKHVEAKRNTPRSAAAPVKHFEAKRNAQRPAVTSHVPKRPRMATVVRKPEVRKRGRTPVAHKPTHPAVAVIHKPAAPKPTAAPAAPAPAVEVEPVISRRDPFAPLIHVSSGGHVAGEHLPPGVGGLVVATVRVDGTVEAPSGMVAVVSNPDDRVYFVRVGDQLYDGDVEKISLDGVTFKENSKDAFGKAVERLVTKRIYPNAGE